MNKKKLNTVIRISLGVILLFFIAFIIYLKNTQLKLSDENIIFSKILKNIIAKDVHKVELDRLTWFEWEKACVHGPYSGPAYEWTDNQTMWTIIFYLKDGTELPMAIGRRLVDPIYPEGGWCFNNRVSVNFITETRGEKEESYTVRLISFSND